MGEGVRNTRQDVEKIHKLYFATCRRDEICGGMCLLQTPHFRMLLRGFQQERPIVAQVRHMRHFVDDLSCDRPVQTVIYGGLSKPDMFEGCIVINCITVTEWRVESCCVST